MIKIMVIIVILLFLILGLSVICGLILSAKKIPPSPPNNN